jgi:hypothetical protein
MGSIPDRRLKFFDHRGGFVLGHQSNKLKKEEPHAPAPEPTAEVKLLTEIRDLLKKR